MFGKSGILHNKQIFQIHTGGLGGSTNGEASNYKNVISDPISMGIHHFAVVDVLKDNSVHVRVITADGVVIDEFLQTADDINQVLVKEITFDKGDTTLATTETLTINATVTLTDSSITTDNTDLIWASSNQSVAIVDANGNVTAVGSGEAVITATAPNTLGTYKIKPITITVQ
jgi:uncharacterized protein YjdB